MNALWGPRLSLVTEQIIIQALMCVGSPHDARGCHLLIMSILRIHWEYGFEDDLRLNQPPR